MTAAVVASEGVSGPSPDTLLRLEGITAGYPTGGTALHDVTLDVPAGAVVGLLGANGAGKTTTLRVISGVLKYSGTVRLAGQELTGPPQARAASGVAHVPEGRKLYAGLSVRENLLLGCAGRPRGDRNQIDADLDRVLELFPELKSLLGRSGAWLSGGEQQMVAIGRALMASPRIVLLDEPTMGLAPIVVDRLVEVIKHGRWGELTLLVAEENVQFATEVSEVCYVLRNGRIVWSGPSSVLRSDSDVRAQLLR